MRQLKITKQITQRNDESISRYFQEINKYPMITADEEVELAVRIRNGDNDALEKLVVANLRFVISVAKQYQNQGLSFPDLINEGNMGLIRAASRFDETKGFKFISYAVWWIRQAITQAVSEQTRIVRLPLNRIAAINKIKKALPHLEQEFEREPTDDEIADFLELTNEEIVQANINTKRQVSFDAPVLRDDNNLSLYDLIQTGDIPSPDHNLLNESNTINILRALKKLSKKEASIIKMSYGLDNTKVYSLYDIGLEYNMSSERVRQIRCNALNKLKNLLSKKYSVMDL